MWDSSVGDDCCICCACMSRDTYSMMVRHRACRFRQSSLSYRFLPSFLYKSTSTLFQSFFVSDPNGCRLSKSEINLAAKHM